MILVAKQHIESALRVLFVISQLLSSSFGPVVNSRGHSRFRASNCDPKIPTQTPSVPFSNWDVTRNSCVVPVNFCQTPCT